MITDYFNMMSQNQCKVCLKTFPSLRQESHHQKVHANDRSFLYQCGLSTCFRKFKTFNGMQSHISQCHRLMPNVQADQIQAVSTGIRCVLCEEMLSSKILLCHHLKDKHLKYGENVGCPFMDVCGRKLPLSSFTIFSKHLSQYHKGWNNKSSAHENLELPSRDNEDDLSGDDAEYFFDAESDLEESFFDANSSFDFEENDVFDYIAKFYLMLEADCFLPVTTIDKISENLSYLSEMSQANMKNVLISELKSKGASVDDVESIVCQLADSNPVYLAHHKHMRGPSFTSEHLRRNYFKKNFSHLSPEPVNLSEDPLEPDAYQYIPPKEILKILFADPSVEKEILDSFERFGKDNGNVYRDYTDGSVCKGRSLPSKRIDILLFQDGYSATTMLNAVKTKHKCTGAYMTLGNFPCELRTKLLFMHLVMKILDKHIKFYRQKCFDRLLKDLKDLEQNGIEFMGELIPVYLQFVVGDNLGSHFLAGFLEGFTAIYFCRFCPITKHQFKRDILAVQPFRTQEDYNEAVRRVQMAELASYHGIKEDSVLNKLDKFKVCDPGFPPCLGHDLFHGVVDWDLTRMLKHFVKKKWFTYKILKRRISEFKYDSFDMKNKPAPVRKGSSSLGGSAVQNWTLLRLLPLIIEGLIKDPDDEVWKAYLKLKHICEFVCAPAIHDDQVTELDLLIKEYLKERSIFSQKTKPKHHYFRHYADLIRLFGPLIHLWGLRFEQKHQFFKRIAKSCNNFINLIYTLATRHQLLFTYESKGNRCPDPISECKSHPIRPGYFSEEIMSLINMHNFSPEVECTTSVKIKSFTFQDGSLLLLDQRDSEIETGTIEGILLDSNEVSFVLRKGKAKLNQDCGLYEIDDTEEGKGNVILSTQIFIPGFI